MSSRILIIGCGGREHSISKSLKKDEVKLFCIGPYVNPGIYMLCEEYSTDVENIENFVKTHDINMTIIGPEAYLEKGVADLMNTLKIPCIGPTKNLARLETDKIFARTSMKSGWDMSDYIPRFSVVSQTEEVVRKPTEKFPPYYSAETFNKDTMKTIVKNTNNNFVIKANGLKSGKGVKVSTDHLKNVDDAYNYCKELIDDKEDFLIEEKLIGNEFSLMSFTDGVSMRHMPVVKDFKRLKENDRGENTGGMGCISSPDHSLDFLKDTDIELTQHLNELTIRNLQNTTKEKY